jgi:hypothetical protein
LCETIGSYYPPLRHRQWEQAKEKKEQQRGGVLPPPPSLSTATRTRTEQHGGGVAALYVRGGRQEDRTWPALASSSLPSSSSHMSSSSSMTQLSPVQKHRQERHKDRHLYRSLSQNRRRYRAGQRANLWMSRHYLSTNNTIARRIQLGIEKRITGRSWKLKQMFGDRSRSRLRPIEDEPVTQE